MWTRSSGRCATSAYVCLVWFVQEVLSSADKLNNSTLYRIPCGFTLIYKEPNTTTVRPSLIPTNSNQNQQACFLAGRHHVHESLNPSNMQVLDLATDEELEAVYNILYGTPLRHTSGPVLVRQTLITVHALAKQHSNIQHQHG